ncbi:MAG: DUF1552 domain-containing protein [Myxococcota bacterium]
MSGQARKTFTKWTRRRTLGAIGGAAMLAPFWRSLKGEAQAGAPRRLLLVFSPNGTIDDLFFPSGGERNFTLKRILEPLEPFRNKIMVLRGLDMKVQGPGDAHRRGMGSLWTGRPLRRSDNTGWPRGMSIDQRVAEHIGGTTRFRSVELALGLYNVAHINTRMIYRDGGDPVAPETNPQRAFERVFDGFSAPDAPSSPSVRARVRASVLDQSRGELAALQRYLGAEGRATLEHHADAIRDLEARLSSMPSGMNASSCTVPGAPGRGFDLHQDRVDPDAAKSMHEIITRAFACDLTRVGSVMWCRGGSPTEYPEAGVNEPHHRLAHKPNRGAVRDRLAAIQRWYATLFVDLLERLDSVPEGDGTMLDNTLVVWGNELNDGERHRHNSMPFVMAGGAGGAIEMGRYLQFNSGSHSDLLTTISHAFGVREDFGDGRWSNGPLSGVLS